MISRRDAAIHGRAPTHDPNAFGATSWAKNLNDVDREVARLATILKVRILDAGVIERVLNKRACAAPAIPRHSPSSAAP